MSFSAANNKLVTTGGSSAQWNVSPQNITDIKTSGSGTELVSFDLASRYQIDLFNDMKEWRADDFPFLTLINNAKNESAVAPYFDWIDEYTGTSWVDIALDQLRTKSVFQSSTFYTGGYTDDAGSTVSHTTSIKPYAVNNASQTGGKLVFYGSVADSFAFPTSSADGSLGATPTAITEKALASGQILTIGFQGATVQGSAEQVCRKMYELMQIASYTIDDAAGSSNNHVLGVYSSTASFPLYMAFDNIAYYDGSTVYQEAEKIARINEFAFKNDFSTIYFKIDFSDSNLRNLSATPTNNYILLEEVRKNASTVTSGYTKISRMVLIGMKNYAPNGIPEGDRLSAGGGSVGYREAKVNNVQIFASRKYGITGTAQATKFRFANDFQKQRERHLDLYKRDQTAAFLYGIKSETYASSTDGYVNGKPVRTTSGLLDYAMYPIKYFKASMPSAPTAASTGLSLKLWADKIVSSLAAFRQAGTKTYTFLCSRDTLVNLTQHYNFIGSHTGGNVIGGMWMVQQPSAATFGLKVYSMDTAYGTVNLIHEPALDFMTSLPTPDFLLGNLNPSKTLISIDMANISKVTLRGDQILGNLQETDRDAVLEGMRGEHGFKVRFPRNHAIIDIS